MIATKGAAVRGAATPLAAAEATADGRRYAVNFNGVNQRGALSSRAIDPDGDIDIRFKTGRSVPVTPSVSLGIVAQAASGLLSQWEAVLRVANPSGTWQLVVGGNTSISSGEPIQPNRSYRVTLIGTVLTYYKDGAVIASGTLIRGAAREPAAPTIIAARATGVGTFSGHYPGQLYDIEINGVLWPMDATYSAVQPSAPVGNSMTLTAVPPSSWRPI